MHHDALPACPVCDFDARFDGTLDRHRERSINFRVERALEALAAETGARSAFAAFVMGTNRTVIKDELLVSDAASAGEIALRLGRRDPGPGLVTHAFSFGKRLRGSVGLLKEGPVTGLDRAIVAKAASRLDSLLFQVLVEFAHRNYVAAVDAALDRFSIDESLARALALLGDYAGAETAGVVFHESGDPDFPDLRAIILTPGGVLRERDVPQEALRSLLGGTPTAEALRLAEACGHFIDTPLVRRGTDQGSVIGRAFAARPDERFDYFERQLLDAFGWLADSRITNYHEMAARLREFLDPKLVRVIVNQPEQYKAILRAKRHVVAMIFADICGFSRMTESLAVETTLDFVNDFLSRMQRVVFRHGGIYDKSVGDCVIALAGPPFIDGKVDDPGRDSHAALLIAADMVREMEAVNRRFESATGEPLELAVGVNTGEVTVGEFGPENSRDYSALGREMNLAARVQGLAGGNQILVTEATRGACLAHQRAHPEVARFTFRRLGERVIKNMKSVLVYEARPPAPREVGMTPPNRPPRRGRKAKKPARGRARERAA